LRSEGGTLTLPPKHAPKDQRAKIVVLAISLIISMYSNGSLTQDCHPMHFNVNEFVRLRLLACFFLLLGLQIPSFANGPLLSSHVDDPVKYLGANHASIERKLAELERNTGYQVFVRTRADTALDSVEEFGLKEFRKLKLGQKGKDDGVLLLIITDYKNLHLEVGADLDDVLHNADADKEIRNALAVKSDTDTGGVVTERSVDVVIGLLQPSFWFKLTHPRTIWAALIIMVLSVGLLLGIVFGIKKYRSR
jgi:uncharacterized protein